jgi:hypothetical protein
MIEAGLNPGLSHPSDFFFEGFEERNDEDDDDEDEWKGR